MNSSKNFLSVPFGLGEFKNHRTVFDVIMTESLNSFPVFFTCSWNMVKTETHLLKWQSKWYGCFNMWLDNQHYERVLFGMYSKFLLKINVQESLEKILTYCYRMVSCSTPSYAVKKFRAYEMEETILGAIVHSVSCFEVFKLNIE